MTVGDVAEYTEMAERQEDRQTAGKTHSVRERPVVVGPEVKMKV